MFRKKHIRDRLTEALAEVETATLVFTQAADALDYAVEELTEVAAEADRAAAEQALRAGTARSQAASAQHRAERIRELLG